jgi:hypothetical protein
LQCSIDTKLAEARHHSLGSIGGVKHVGSSVHGHDGIEVTCETCTTLVS